VIFPDATLLDMLRHKPRTLSDMAGISGVGTRKLERYGPAFLAVLQGVSVATEDAKSPLDLRHEVISLACAGMAPEQIARRLSCTERNVYQLLATAIGQQQLSLEQALDIPEELLGEIQDLFLEGEGELPSAASLYEQLEQAVPIGVLYCIRAALLVEFGD
jgi:ATP-dependent DNA helicase RecQ